MTAALSNTDAKDAKGIGKGVTCGHILGYVADKVLPDYAVVQKLNVDPESTVCTGVNVGDALNIVAFDEHAAAGNSYSYDLISGPMVHIRYRVLRDHIARGGHA